MRLEALVHDVVEPEGAQEEQAGLAVLCSFGILCSTSLSSSSRTPTQRLKYVTHPHVPGMSLQLVEDVVENTKLLHALIPVSTAAQRQYESMNAERLTHIFVRVPCQTHSPASARRALAGPCPRSPPPPGVICGSCTVAGRGWGGANSNYRVDGLVEARVRPGRDRFVWNGRLYMRLFPSHVPVGIFQRTSSILLLLGLDFLLASGA